MDILYIVGKNCSKCDNFELRCSLRSIDKYGKNVRNVYVAGECPDWLSNEVVKVPYDQPYTNPDDMTDKALNIISTILYVVDHTDIGDEFLVSMDDHIYVRDTDFDEYPYYARMINGKFTLPEDGESEYKKFLIKTREFCIENGLSHYFLTIHRNMHCSRAMVAETRPILEKILKEKISCEGMVFMLNWWYTKHNLVITPIEDVRLRGGIDWWKTDPFNTEVFSTPDFDNGIGLYTLLEGLFPGKCKYEK